MDGATEDIGFFRLRGTPSSRRTALVAAALNGGGVVVAELSHLLLPLSHCCFFVSSAPLALELNREEGREPPSSLPCRICKARTDPMRHAVRVI